MDPECASYIQICVQSFSQTQNFDDVDDFLFFDTRSLFFNGILPHFLMSAFCWNLEIFIVCFFLCLPLSEYLSNARAFFIILLLSNFLWDLVISSDLIVLAFF